MKSEYKIGERFIIEVTSTISDYCVTLDDYVNEADPSLRIEFNTRISDFGHDRFAIRNPAGLFLKEHYVVFDRREFDWVRPETTEDPEDVMSSIAHRIRLLNSGEIKCFDLKARLLYNPENFAGTFLISSNILEYVYYYETDLEEKAHKAFYEENIQGFEKGICSNLFREYMEGLRARIREDISHLKIMNSEYLNELKDYYPQIWAIENMTCLNEASIAMGNTNSYENQVKAKTKGE